jgi:hypothetical protein
MIAGVQTTTIMPINDVQLSEDRWLDFFEHYKGLPGQQRGLLMLRKHIIEADPGLLTEGAQWIEETRQNAQPDVPNTWEGIEMAARVAGAKFPALVAAQWALESDWGKKPAGVNNFWGLKGLSGTVKATLEEVNGVMRPETATFKDFPTIRAGVEYLVTRWYADFQQHKGVNRANTIAEAARLLQSQGYATDSKYPEKLLGILSRRTPTLATPAQQPATTRHLDPRGSEEAGMAGPQKAAPVKPGDTYLLVNDRDQDMEAYDHTGKLLWKIPCLGRGQGADTDWTRTNTDTPPGLYKLGKLYADYEQNANPPCSDTAMAYGWYSFDMEEQEGQEVAHGRAGIMLHGGGSACGWPMAWAPQQPLHPTLGCVRLHNADLRDKVLPLYRQGTVYVGVFQEKK